MSIAVCRCAVAGCPQVKHEENHWWMVARFGADVIQVGPWNERLFEHHGVKSACGRECALKLVSELLEEVANERRKTH